jgi:hypothetical protein
MHKLFLNLPLDLYFQTHNIIAVSFQKLSIKAVLKKYTSTKPSNSLAKQQAFPAKTMPPNLPLPSRAISSSRQQ